MPSGAEALRDATTLLQAAAVPGAERDAQILLLHVLSLPRHRLSDALQDPVPEAALARYRQAIAARAGRQPVSQILGRRAFWKHDFRVTPDTLDPRPETELLVELALAEAFDSVLDLGTGTGAILISLLADRRGATGTGTDLSTAALEVARGNARRIGVAARFLHSDWFAAVTGQFGLIVSNPPYIALSEMAALSPEVRDWEPRLALTDEADGLTAYRAICADAPAHLRPGGRLMVEIGPSQGGGVSALMAAAGLADIAVFQDLDGRDRVVRGRK